MNEEAEMLTSNLVLPDGKGQGGIDMYIALEDNYGIFGVLSFPDSYKGFWEEISHISEIPGVKNQCSLWVDENDPREIEICVMEITDQSYLPDHFPAERIEKYTLPEGARVVW